MPCRYRSHILLGSTLDSAYSNPYDPQFSRQPATGSGFRPSTSQSNSQSGSGGSRPSWMSGEGSSVQPTTKSVEAAHHPPRSSGPADDTKQGFSNVTNFTEEVPSEVRREPMVANENSLDDQATATDPYQAIKGIRRVMKETNFNSLEEYSAVYATYLQTSVDSSRQLLSEHPGLSVEEIVGVSVDEDDEAKEGKGKEWDSKACCQARWDAATQISHQINSTSKNFNTGYGHKVSTEGVPDDVLAGVLYLDMKASDELRFGQAGTSSSFDGQSFATFQKYEAQVGDQYSMFLNGSNWGFSSTPADPHVTTT